MKITPAQVTLNALRDGAVMTELAQAIHDGMEAVDGFRKPAEINLRITIRPIGTQGVSDAFELIGDITTKLPKQQSPSTLFFIDADGNPSRKQDRQQEFAGLSVATAIKPTAAA